MPAWYMKFTPLARRSLSSAGGRPSRMLGLLTTSSRVKNHWFGMVVEEEEALGAGDKGEGALRRE